MSEIPEDIMRASLKVTVLQEHPDCERPELPIALALLEERNRCISIAQSIEPHNEAEAHLIETIVRRMRGEE